MNKVFLGGTCNGSEWRNKLIPMLKIDYFNPVVPNWTEECYQEELRQRENCDYCLYVITPLMKGFYSIAEVVDDSNKRAEKTLFCVLSQDKILFTDAQEKSLTKIAEMVTKNGGTSFDNLASVAVFLNSRRGEGIMEKICNTQTEINERELVYNLYELSVLCQMEVLGRLGLLSENDKREFNTTILKNSIQQAKEQGKLQLLYDYVNEYLTQREEK